ncbi:hypothetical protein PtrM4_091280 [Pyrenophora tritici-repentis]|uniref:Zn(2)-C6 fungal-type domain-containing protein n=1 Tax=Pyrenophora tritici-repentis TaxID=45151 RepID=A0A834VQE1_9PLEO|nr:hypothetical protein PtrM4_133600 [Pyrenophora tritici-repentis]CAA9965768.1 hypothetical protein PTMSG1_09127 [Pyrenophora teres f. maculata]KAF7571359.1 hypothetical protein PtrM4_088590 [Pyrenophora tritici-repentis]KAF7571628.1 hypothetical protein PtrM4_091280 [Pyrenophora tritici-repentis]KAI1507629.1 hypothetical protein Ptr86124_013418 [Pyrenophora tritici-repentis]
MPKEPRTRASRKKTTTEERYERLRRVELSGREMPFRCERCEKNNLRCFVDTVSGRCAGCISARCDCELFVPEEEWEKVEQEKRDKELALLRLEEEVARARRELAEIRNRELAFARRDRKLLDASERAQSSESGSTVAASSSIGSTADPGWSQANNLLDPSLDQILNDFFLEASASDLDPFSSAGSSGIAPGVADSL